MKIKYFGHSTFGIEIEKQHLLIDPFISGNPMTKHLNLKLIKANYILVTHAHEDHILDVQTIGTIQDSVVISNFEIVNHFIERGIKGHHLNHGGSFHTNTFSIKYVNAVHTSSFPDGKYGGQAGGFIISTRQKVIYIAGDTALTTDMTLLPKMYKKIDLAILPIGDVFTMGVKDALLASDLLSVNKVIGCHYDTFPPIKIDKTEAKNIFSEAGKELILMSLEEVIEI